MFEFVFFTEVVLFRWFLTIWPLTSPRLTSYMSIDMFDKCINGIQGFHTMIPLTHKWRIFCCQYCVILFFYWVKGYIRSWRYLCFITELQNCSLFPSVFFGFEFIFGRIIVSQLTVNRFLSFSLTAGSDISWIFYNDFVNDPDRTFWFCCLLFVLCMVIICLFYMNLVLKALENPLKFIFSNVNLSPNKNSCNLPLKLIWPKLKFSFSVSPQFHSKFHFQISKTIDF